MASLSSLGPQALQHSLRSAAGLLLHMGPFVSALRTPLPDVAQAVGRLYADYDIAADDTFTDFHVGVRRPAGLRRWWKPQVCFEQDSMVPFNPLPGDQGFPLLEWGLNWCVYSQCHQYLILHAAVLERNGRALIMPAPSGSGKSTLCAGLLFHGWRLLSDELALICPAAGNLVPNPRPVSLKNASIDVLQALVPQVQFGSRVHETSKGVVAHFAVPAPALRLAHQHAEPAWVVLPKYLAGAPARLSRVGRARMLMHLVQNAFNYDVFGAEGFDLLASVADRSTCLSFEYSSLPEAMDLFARLADGTLPLPS